MHHYDHLPPLPAGGPSIHQIKNPVIPSVTDMSSYPHQFQGTFASALVVCFGEGNAPGGGTVYYKVTEKHVDIYGNPIAGKSDNILTFDSGKTYNGIPAAISGCVYKGYKWDAKPDSGGSDYTAGNPSLVITRDEVVYLVYAREFTVTEKYMDKNGNPLEPPVTDTIFIVPADTPSYSKTVPEQIGYKALGYFIGDPYGGTYTAEAAVKDYQLTGDITVYFVYQKITALTVSKTVTGDYANRDRLFEFSVYFEDSDGNAPAPGMVYGFIKESGDGTIEKGTLTATDGGLLVFSLKHGQSIVINGVDEDGKIRIVEAEDSRYEVSFMDSVLGKTESNDTGPQMRDMTPGRVFGFINERTDVPETAVDSGYTGLLISLPILALLTSFVFLAAKANHRRRKLNVS